MQPLALKVAESKCDPNPCRLKWLGATATPSTCAPIVNAQLRLCAQLARIRTGKTLGIPCRFAVTRTLRTTAQPAKRRAGCCALWQTHHVWGSAATDVDWQLSPSFWQLWADHGCAAAGADYGCADAGADHGCAAAGADHGYVATRADHGCATAEADFGCADTGADHGCAATGAEHGNDGDVLEHEGSPRHDVIWYGIQRQHNHRG
eukprot:scaffold28795_cov22-Tisochrysis_lutea.AAC.1